MNKGIVLQLHRFKMTVLTDDGQFTTIWRQRNCQIGQVVTWKTNVKMGSLPRLAVSVAVALLLVVMTGESLHVEKDVPAQPVVVQQGRAIEPMREQTRQVIAVERTTTVRKVKSVHEPVVAVATKAAPRVMKETAKIVKPVAVISEAPAVQTSEAYETQLSQEPVMLPRENELPLENSVEALPVETPIQEQPLIVEQLTYMGHPVI